MARRHWHTTDDIDDRDARSIGMRTKKAAEQARDLSRQMTRNLGIPTRPTYTVECHDDECRVIGQGRG